MHLSPEQQRAYDAAPWREIPAEPCPWARYRLSPDTDALVIVAHRHASIAWIRLALVVRPGHAAVAYRGFGREAFLQRGPLSAIGLVPNGITALRSHRALALDAAVRGVGALGVILAYRGGDSEQHLVPPYDPAAPFGTH